MSENSIAQNIFRIREEIAELAVKNHRDPNEITLIGVSKFFPAQAAEEAVLAGLQDLGENRVQELLDKREILAEKGLLPQWHLIGTLQRRKVRQIVGKTCLIHSVDTPELMTEISKCSVEKGIVSPVLFELNISEEESKHGFDPSGIDVLLEQAAACEGILLQGVMTMAPFTQDELVLNRVFSQAREYFGRMQSKVGKDSFRILSMGMSNDYPIAVRHGATHLRIGTAIFGKRDAHA